MDRPSKAYQSTEAFEETSASSKGSFQGLVLSSGREETRVVVQGNDILVLCSDRYSDVANL